MAQVRNVIGHNVIIASLLRYQTRGGKGNVSGAHLTDAQRSLNQMERLFKSTLRSASIIFHEIR